MRVFPFAVVLAFIVGCGGAGEGDTSRRSPRLELDVVGLPAPERPEYRVLDLAPGEPAPTGRIFAWLDRGVATVGEVVELTVAVNHLPSMEVTFPTVRRMNRFEVLPSALRDQEPVAGGRIVSLRRYQLQAFVPGDYVVPAVPVLLTAPNGRRQRMRSEGLAVVVVSVIPDQVTPEDLIDIKDPLSIEAPLDLRPVGAIAGLLALIAAGLTYLVLRRRKMEAEDEGPLAPHELALHDMQELEERGWIGQGLYDQHFMELDRIFRTYLAQRFEIPSMQRASEEIAGVLGEHPAFGDHTLEIAQRFMVETDRVKFARHEPPRPACDSVRSDLLYLIDLTRPVETEAPAAEVEGEA